MIKELENNKQEIEDYKSKANSLNIEKVGFENSIDGLYQDVQELVDQEKNDEKSFQQELADETVETIDEESSENFDSNYEEIIGAIDQNTDYLTSLIEDTESDLDEDIDSIFGYIDQIENDLALNDEDTEA